MKKEGGETLYNLPSPPQYRDITKPISFSKLGDKEAQDNQVYESQYIIQEMRRRLCFRMFVNTGKMN